jgi:6-phosphogluconolactonase
MQVYPDLESLVSAAAEQVATLAEDAVAARGRFSVALSGGSTPRPVYELLAADEFAARIDWSRVHIFWGDERCVPPDHPDSNSRMTRQALLDRVPIPPRQIHRMQGEIDPARAAIEYEAALRAFFGSGDETPRFDLVLLGMGDDGHTASLFPGTTALNERRRWVTENYVARLGTWRITLTPPALNAARNVIFLVSGPGKAEVLHTVLHERYQPDRFPSQLIQPVRGRLLWMIDQAAAALLSHG